jgi:hypothetical protein
MALITSTAELRALFGILDRRVLLELENRMAEKSPHQR